METLQNGAGGREAQPEVAAALSPLLAYQKELRRQQALGVDAAEGQACFDAVKEGFRKGLEELTLKA